MLRGVVLISLAALVLLPQLAMAGGSEDMLYFSGFDYQTDGTDGPDLTPDSLSVGEGFAAVATVSAFVEPLASLADFGTYEYTFVLSGVTITTAASFSGFVVVTGAGGRIDVYEDARLGGTAATYGTHPPNSDAPSSFVDGLLVLSAPIEDFVLFRSNSTGQGGWTGEATPDGGAWIASVPTPNISCLSYLFDGAINAMDPGIPAGYSNLNSGRYALQCGLPVQKSTWGELKTRYR